MEKMDTCMVIVKGVNPIDHLGLSLVDQYSFFVSSQELLHSFKNYSRRNVTFLFHKHSHCEKVVVLIELTIGSYQTN